MGLQERRSILERRLYGTTTWRFGSVQGYHWWCSGLRCGAEVLSRREITGLKEYLGKKALQDNDVEVWFKGITGSVQDFGVELKY